MPIELSAATRRSTYFAGESITVSINIQNIYQAVNRYLYNNPNPNNPTSNNISPYGSINGVPSINQMKNKENSLRGRTPNNSNLNLRDLENQFDQKLNLDPNSQNLDNLGSLQNLQHGKSKDDRSRKSRIRGSNPSLNNPNSHKTSQSNLINTNATNCSANDSSERVAWVSVYMHCECNVNRNKVAFQNISAALAPVKSIFSHDFEGTNTDVQSHLFDEGGNLNHSNSNDGQNSSGNKGGSGWFGSGDRNQGNSGNGRGSNKNHKNSNNLHSDMRNGMETDSGIGNGSSSSSGSNSSGQGKAGNGKNNGNTITVPKTSLAPDRDSTGICVLQTPPQILVCDLTLKPGEQKKLVYREKIPVEAPPSYSGSLLKYSYKLTVSVQRVGGSIRQIKLPFRVLVLYGLSDYQGVEEMPLNSNPFLDQPLSTIKREFVNFLDFYISDLAVNPGFEIQKIFLPQTLKRFNVQLVTIHVRQSSTHSQS